VRALFQVALAAVAAVVVAGCAGAAPGPTSAAHPASGPTARAATPAPARGRTRAVVGVTTGNALVVLDATTGAVLRTLVPSAVNGDEVAVSPDGSTVYYEERTGCDDQIMSVPLAGGASAVVAVGGLPALSPDGTELAMAREPATATRQLAPSCLSNPAARTASYSLIVRNLRSGRETSYPMSPELVSGGLPFPISHLSWAPDGARLAVSISAPEDNVGWALVVIDTRSDRYYYTSGAAGIPVTSGPDVSRSYYREGVFMPDGDLFVNRVCCAGLAPAGPAVTSTLLWEMSPAGAFVHQVAIGFTDRAHTSLDAEPAGHWLLYLSNADLYVSQDGRTPSVLASGLVAAAWAELP
jgi:hypothetical protein